MSLLCDIVVATDLKRGIGKNQALPWKLSAEIDYFKRLTTSVINPAKQNAVIMGRKTWETIPSQYTPLKERLNIVLTRDENYQLREGVLKASSLTAALEQAEERGIEKCFLIGGAAIYKEYLLHESINLLYLTEIKAIFDCKAFFPPYEKYFSLISVSPAYHENNLEYCFKTYKRITNRLTSSS